MAHFSCGGSMNEVVEEYGGAKPTMSQCYVISLVTHGADYFVCRVFFARFALFLLIHLLFLK